MGNAVLQGGRLNNSQETRFQAAKRSYIGIGFLQLTGRYHRTLESLFPLRKVKIWVVPQCMGVILLILKKRVFRLRYFLLRAVPTRKDFDFLLLSNCVFRLRIVQIWVMPSCKLLELLLLKNRVLGCETFGYG